MTAEPGGTARAAPVDRVLVVNAGSSSLKLSLLGPTDTVLAELDIDSWDGEPGHGGMRDFVAGIGDVDAVGHRVVHGGDAFRGPVVIDADSRAAIADLASLAPLHQPRAVAGIDAVGALLPEVAAVACFDTAFHASIPAAAATYALPAAWRERFGLRRYGFHGLSHGYAARRAAQLLDRPPARLRVVTCHLGSGSSLAAVRAGRSVDTTMGFTPLEGLVMATRPGNVDPGLLVWLLQRDRISLAELSEGLEHASGLAGLAGLAGPAAVSGDMRNVQAAASAGAAQAQLALAVYTHRLRQQVASMAAAMNGLDAMVFTGGIGEHSAAVRADAAAGLGFLGIVIDDGRNYAACADTDISAEGAAVRTLVITAREDIEIAGSVRGLLGAAGTAREASDDRAGEIDSEGSAVPSRPAR